MKIIFVFDSTYPYYTGGIETWIYNVCERLIKKHEVTIFTVENFRKDNNAGVFTNINPNIRIVPVKNMNHVPGIRHFVHKHIAVYNSNITTYSMYREIIKYINFKDTYYVIGLGTVFAAKTVRLLKKRFKNIKAITSCRSLHPEILAEEYPGVGCVVKRLERKNLLSMDAVWTNGLDTQEALRKKGFESVVIKNGVNFKKLDEEKKFDYKEIGLEDKTIIATIGTVSKVKGYYEIIRAVKVLKEVYNLEVHFVGIGKVNKRNAEIYNKYAKKLEVEKQIHLLGEHRNVVAYAKGADIMLCTSGGGGYGMAILESMVSKTPIVAWNTPVYQQLLKDGHTAKLVNQWDSNALADGIYYILNHNREVISWGERANIAAKDFDWSIVVKEIEDALQSIH